MVHIGDGVNNELRQRRIILMTNHFDSKINDLTQNLLELRTDAVAENARSAGEIRPESSAAGMRTPAFRHDNHSYPTT